MTCDCRFLTRTNPLSLQLAIKEMIQTMFVLVFELSVVVLYRINYTVLGSFVTEISVLCPWRLECPAKGSELENYKHL